MMGRRIEFLHMLQNEVAVSTIFSRHEINCIPWQLVAEFYRTVTAEDKAYSRELHLPMKWMDLAVVDALPYMYYLQYLIFRTTGLISDKDIAFKNLQTAIFRVQNDHIDTSLNLIGHCYELEGNLPKAWRVYKFSVELKSKNNAAYWHMFRMIGGLINGLRMLSW
ncbi:hypothetical protein DPMN_162029 [Dreissena polymorpha]|uniref:Uncharacterized protein n=1 Tax=Dreissena polymorpha TaxID=45954 RepID=A0A9D4ERJ0_DREPO|nr:hypothetical protein DPMN_162029 [Dreissena polymorpha]